MLFRSILVGTTTENLGSTLALREVWSREDGAPPCVDLAVERRAGDAVRAMIGQGLIKACHDLADGGLAIGLADMVMASGTGMAVRLPDGLSSAAGLFAEDQGRYLLVIDPAKADLVFDALDAAGVPSAPLGQAGGCELAIQNVLAIDVEDLRASFEAWMPAWIGN